jgi:hypothetical protein
MGLVASSRGGAAGPEAPAAGPDAVSLASGAGRPTGGGCELPSPACQAAAARRAGDVGGASGEEPAGSGLGATAGAHAGPAGLADVLHGAPALLAAIKGGPRPNPDPRSSSHILRRVSRGCCEAVDAPATRLRLNFDTARQENSRAPRSLATRLATRLATCLAAARIWLDFGLAWLVGGQGGPARQAAPMVRRLAKAPALTGLHCTNPRGAELEQLLAGAAAAQPSAVAGVQRLVVHAYGRRSAHASPDVFGPGLPALLRSLAHLPRLQVRARGCSAAAGRMHAC